MCGIVGRVNAESQKPVNEDALRAASRWMVHRGPDGEGLYLAPGVGLAHRRLAIVDLSGGAQPMSNEDGTVWVTFNGEIYNHAELRPTLEARGHRFATQSDTEVLVHGWEEWGEALPTKLRGMFAFALWDTRTQRLFAARDRLGKKPLYWTQAGEDLLFASEAKSLFCFPDVQRALRSDALPRYLALRYVPGAQTLFAGIERLEPGHWLSFQRGGALRISRYWDVPVDAWEPCSPLDEAAETERFLARLEESVQIRKMGEVPVGVFLSGGIDSTTIAWAMRRADASPLKSFSVGFDGDSEGELAYARLAARALGTQHREVRLNAAQFGASMEELVWHLDEPNADGACVPLMHLSRRAKEEVVVVLSGEGADEVLGGYGIYQKMLAIEQAQRFGGQRLRNLMGWAQRHLPDGKVQKYLGLASRPLEQRYFGVGRAFSDGLLVEAFGPLGVQSLVDTFAPVWRRSRNAPLLHRLLYTDTKIWLPDDLLVKADKMTMAWAIELRVPFLDHLLLEDAWRLPPSLKLRAGQGKYLLRRAMRDRIPPEIVDRPKKGFPVPLGRWLRSSLYGPCREALLASGSGARTVMDVRLISKLLEEHQLRRVDRTEELYALWVFEHWYQTFLSRSMGQRLQNRVRTEAVPGRERIFGTARPAAAGTRAPLSTPSVL